MVNIVFPILVENQNVFANWLENKPYEANLQH